MIRYDLKCKDGHTFEAWFGSSDDFNDQKARGFVTCAFCGTDDVAKALMAPGVPAKANKAEAAQPMLSQPSNPVEEKLRELRKEIEANSDYVGDKFATEARAMHLGDTEHRAIYGEATGAEAKALVEDGVPVAPLPFAPRRDS